jgi:cation:H+ antiporter
MNPWLIALLEIVFGFALLIIGGEFLVKGASRLAAAMKISPLVIGLTVVAFGTSSPELAVSAQSAFTGKADLALGNVVGSNIFNVLFILGVSALIVPLVVSSRLIRLDVPLMIFASVLVPVFGLDGKLGRFDGLFLFSALMAYIVWCIVQSRRESQSVRAEFAQELPSQEQDGTTIPLQIGLVITGLFLLGLGSHWLIQGSVFVAAKMGFSELVIGLTIVAAGTSLPEVVTSIMAAWRGEREIAVGNVVGSNIFNILGVLGLSSFVASEGIAISESAMRFDIPVMIAVAVSCLPIFLSGNQIARWEGGLFFAYYIAYTTYMILASTQANVTRTFGAIMTMFVIPLTVITLLIGVVRHKGRKSMDVPSEEIT